MSQDTLFASILAGESRPNPYPLYAMMRKTPVARQADGTYVVSSYDAIYRLLYDPRLSSEDLPPPLLFHWAGNPIKDLIVDPIKEQIRARHRPFIFRDPPDHVRAAPPCHARILSGARARHARQDRKDYP